MNLASINWRDSNNLVKDDPNQNQTTNVYEVPEEIEINYRKFLKGIGCRKNFAKRVPLGHSSLNFFTRYLEQSLPYDKEHTHIFDSSVFTKLFSNQSGNCYQLRYDDFAKDFEASLIDIETKQILLFPFNIDKAWGLIVVVHPKNISQLGETCHIQILTKNENCFKYGYYVAGYLFMSQMRVGRAVFQSNVEHRVVRIITDIYPEDDGLYILSYMEMICRLQHRWERLTTHKKPFHKFEELSVICKFVSCKLIRKRFYQIVRQFDPKTNLSGVVPANPISLLRELPPDEAPCPFL